jgi:thioredoxin reductase
MESTDLTIIGGGPTGMAAAFRAGMHEISARIIDTASQLGGQVMALYPEKKIYDVFGLPEVSGKDLVHNLMKQALQFGADVRLGESVQGLRFADADKRIEVITDQGSYPTRTVLLAGGLGLITPRKHDAEGCDRLEGKGVYYSVRDPELFRGKKVVIVGGGDSALDWALNLRPIAARVTLVHRSQDFAGHASTLREVQQLADFGHITLHTSTLLTAAHGNGNLEAVTLRNSRGVEHTMEAQALLPMIGFHVNLGPMERWGLEFEEKKIVVNLSGENQADCDRICGSRNRGQECGRIHSSGPEGVAEVQQRRRIAEDRAARGSVSQLNSVTRTHDGGHCVDVHQSDNGSCRNWTWAGHRSLPANMGTS